MRYFIHIVTASKVILDQEGAEFTDLAAAERESLESMRELAAEALRREGTLPLDWQVRISDQSGHTVAAIPFARLAESGNGAATQTHSTLADSTAELARHAVSSFEKARQANRDIKQGLTELRGQLRRLSQLKTGQG